MAVLVLIIENSRTNKTIYLRVSISFMPIEVRSLTIFTFLFTLPILNNAMKKHMC